MLDKPYWKYMFIYAGIPKPLATSVSHYYEVPFDTNRNNGSDILEIRQIAVNRDLSIGLLLSLDCF